MKKHVICAMVRGERLKLFADWNVLKENKWQKRVQQSKYFTVGAIERFEDRVDCTIVEHERAGK